jgi:multicomponent Na+:H+ antiporter subunit D
LVLLFASAGVFHHSGIKIPYFAFYAHDSGIRCEEAPKNMLLAMGITAFLCVAIGIFPGPLYAILPYALDYEPYTTTHVITQLQLLMFSALAFTVLMRTGIYPPELRAVNLDWDWTYRRALPSMVQRLRATGGLLLDGASRTARDSVRAAVANLYRHHGPQGVLAKDWPTGSMAIWVAAMLGLSLVLYYLL